MSSPKLIAIIPAAGLSRRMGQPKLLLPWRGTTVIAHLIGELKAAGVEHVLVVQRASDRDLQTAVESAGGICLLPAADPPDMRTSVEIGLGTAFKPGDATFSGWLLIPADHPIVSRQTVTALLMAWQASQPPILIPTYQGHRGHPTLFSSDLAREIPRIPKDSGLNWLVRQYSKSIQEVPVSDPGVIVDLDTPEDYQRLLNSP